MNRISTIGLDIAKHFFQAHGVDDKGQTVVKQKLRRDNLLVWLSQVPPCIVALEACATSHYWAREIGALGHQVRLIPPTYVKPYVKRQKNDAIDAAAICEAATRPAMSFVTPKNEDQQAVQVLHRTRDLLIRQRTQAINALRAHLAEFGLIFNQGNAGVRAAIEAVNAANDSSLHPVAKQALQALVRHLDELDTNIKVPFIDKSSRGIARTPPASGWRPFPGLAPSPPRRYAPLSATANSFAKAATSRLGSVLCPSKTPAAVKTGLAALRARAMHRCEVFWCSAPPGNCAASVTRNWLAARG